MSKQLGLIMLVLLPFYAVTQVVSDAKLWGGISVNKKVNDFEFSLSEEMRMDENASHIDKFFTEVGVQYKMMKGFYLGLNYRYSRDNDYETRNYDLTHRVDIGLTYKRKLNDFRFAVRTKLQAKSALPEKNNPTYSRTKFTIKYKLKKKVTPYVAYEFYYQFNAEKVINRARFYVGSAYKINGDHALKVFYLFENKFNTTNLEHNHVYGISYSIDL